MPATVKLGSQGDPVPRWQELLSANGHSVAITGVFDAATDAATRAWQAGRGLVADGIAGPASWSAMTGEASPVPALSNKRAEAHRFGRQVLQSIWREVTGEDPNLASLQIAGAQADLESGYGRASYKNRATGETAILNNWGAVQAGPPPCGPDGFEATDTRADGTPYQWCYKRYTTPEEGAKHMLAHLTTKRPASWAKMREGDVDGWAAQMRRKDPITGIGLYFEQSVEGRARGIELRVKEIAAAMGEPVAAKRGGPPVGLPGEIAAGGVGLLGAGVLGGLAYWIWSILRR